MESQLERTEVLQSQVQCKLTLQILATVVQNLRSTNYDRTNTPRTTKYNPTRTVFVNGMKTQKTTPFVLFGMEYSKSD